MKLERKLVYEVGMVKEGLPIVRRQYGAGDGKIDPIMVSGFLTAIQDFAVRTFNDIPETFKMSKTTAILHRVDFCDDCLVFLYAICEPRANQEKVKKALTKITKGLEKWKTKLLTTTIIEKDFEVFNPLFDETILPINQDYSERAKKKISLF